MTTRPVWWRARSVGFAVAVGTLFQATCAHVVTSPQEQAQLDEQLREIGIRQVANLVTDTVFFLLDNTLVRLAR
jgi:hypothetical protein